MKKLAFMLTLIMLFTSLAGAWAEQSTPVTADLKAAYDQAVGLREAEKYDEALPLFRQLAEQNYAPAMREIGQAYLKGWGVTADPAQAVVWLEKASELGDAPAMYLLGYNYKHGHFGAVDYAAAVKWYEAAAGLNYPAALNNLGVMYANGEGVEKDMARAMTLFQKSADLGNPYAMLNYGRHLAHGTLGTPDYQQAARYLQMAVDAGHTDGAVYSELGALHYNGLLTGTPDYAAALPLMEKGSELGNASATTTLANMYYFGYGVKKDDVRAEQYLILAHEQGNVNATIYLGDRYLAGDFPGGVEKAADWYRKAVELGREDAQEKLNALAGIPADAALLQSLEETVASGKFDETHLAQLGKMYLDGVPGVVRADPAKAFAVLSKVEQVERKIQDGTAYALLARMYENGEGTQKDLAKAGAYYLDAAYFDNGLPYAEKAADIFEQLGDVKQELRALKRAMALGCTDLHKQFDLGNLYYTGEATGAPDYATAKKYFDLAAGQNECNALAYLGNMYYLGYGVEQNYALAEDYYTRSHYAGHSAIAGYMVQYYSSGVFPGGVAKVLEWQRICAEQGHYSAVEYMAKACVEGVRDENGNVILEADYSAALPLLEHVYNNDATNGYLVSWYGYLTEYPPEGQPDYARALEIYKDGYALGDGFSASALGKFYANGLGVEVDLEKARTYYQKAVELGYTQAQDELDKLSR